MSPGDPDPQPNTTDVGWRIQQLRLRRGLRQKELADLAGVDNAYLSRLEKTASRHPKPKADTITRILDALQATPQEREAVFHVEHPPISREEIAGLVEVVIREKEDDPVPVTILDNRWFRWYQNRATRAAFGVTRDVYHQVLGEHILAGVVDPESYLYSRHLDEERINHLVWRANAFKLNFADRQFDRWYLDVVEMVGKFPWAAEVWESPPPDTLDFFLYNTVVTIANPNVGTLRFRGQLDRLMMDPRFTILHLTPFDEQTAQKMSEQWQRPEFHIPPDELLSSLP